MNKFRLQMNDKFYESSNCVKYLGVYLDQNLSFQEGVKHILGNMACGIKTLYSIREYLPEKNTAPSKSSCNQSPPLPIDPIKWSISKSNNYTRKTIELRC